MLGDANCDVSQIMCLGTVDLDRAHGAARNDILPEVTHGSQSVAA